MTTSDYDTDVVAWSERQANALRRRAANEIDWDNVAEEIQDVGRSEINATLSQIDKILRHRLYLIGWPDDLSARQWRAELPDFWRQLRRHYRESMSSRDDAPVTDATVREAYVEAKAHCLRHMLTAPTHPLSLDCPWRLGDLLKDPST